MRILIAAVAIAVIASPCFAGQRPNYNCEKQNNICVKACDDSADASKNARTYQKCLKACDDALTSCTARQEVTNNCADIFQSCIAGASSESAKEKCRSAYRSCKGTP